MPSTSLGLCPHCLFRLGLATAPTEQPSVGSVPMATAEIKPIYFGDYELLSCLSRGGMGEIWKARDLTLGRFVALKMIQGQHLTTPEARFRFQIEIEAVARLDHPNIVRLYESGEVNGVHFFTMNLVEGGSLAEALVKRRSEMPEAEAATQASQTRRLVALLVKVCRAVDYAHQRGILHRDIKPSNILIDGIDEPHVADFGLAKVATLDSDLTVTQSVIGSPNYMAPEQASGRTRQISVATDVYGLGAVLYEIITGFPPFRAESMAALIFEVLTNPPTSPRSLRPDVDHDLETICLKCLEKNPAARYRSAKDLAEELERWLEGRTISARPVGPGLRLWRWCGREPGLATALGVIFLLMLIVTLGAVVAAVQVRRAERQAVALLRQSLLDQARSGRLNGEMGGRQEGMRLIRQAEALGGSAEFRGQLRDELMATLGRTDTEFVPLAEFPKVRRPTLALLDPSLKVWAGIEDETNLVIRRALDGKETTRIFVVGSPVVRVEQFSPDSRFLALRHVDGLSFWDLKTGIQCFATNGPNRCFSFATHRPLLILEEWFCQASLWELPTMTEAGRIRGPADASDQGLGGWSAISIAPDGTLFAGARARDHVLELIELKDDHRRWRAQVGTPVNAIAWSPLRERVVTGGSDGGVTFWRLDNGHSTVKLGQAASVRGIGLNADETLLAAACEDRTVQLWNLDVLQRTFSSQCDSYWIGFSPDGKTLGTVMRGDQVGRLELARSSVVEQFKMVGPSPHLEACGFSRDGRVVAGGMAGQIEFRSVESNDHLAEVACERLPIFAFDPKDDAILTSDSRGVQRRTMHWEPSRSMALSESEIIFPGKGWRALSFRFDGTWFAAANIRSNAAFVYDRSFTNVLFRSGIHEGVDCVALSPNGRWLATASSRHEDLRVWEIPSGQVVLSASTGQAPRVCFSTDGAWMVVHGKRLVLRRSGTWETAPPLPWKESGPLTGAAAFSPDGRVMAVVVDQFVVQLFDLQSWEAIGALRPPSNQATINAITFNLDGDRLALACSGGNMQIWNLHQLRTELSEFGLDWDLPGLGHR